MCPYILTVPRKLEAQIQLPQLLNPYFSQKSSSWPSSPASALCLTPPPFKSQAFTQFPALVSTIAATGKRYGWLQHFLRSIMMLSRET